jgi:hypothetical protein
MERHYKAIAVMFGIAAVIYLISLGLFAMTAQIVWALFNGFGFGGSVYGACWAWSRARQSQ